MSFARNSPPPGNHVAETERRFVAAHAAAGEVPPEEPAAEAELEAEEVWAAPPFQPLRAILALLFTAAGFGLYQYVLLSFWSSPAFGIHERIPYPVYAGMGAAIVLCLIAIRLALGIWSPHAKLAFGLLALFACIVVAVSGGRFVSYTLRGTLNPPFTLNLKLGDHFPRYALADQNGSIHRGPGAGRDGSLMVVYRGDFCPFARYELAELTRRKGELARAGLSITAISADPVERSKMLAGFIGTDIPLLSDVKESILGPLGLVQRHRDGEPDNAIPAFLILDREGIVRWIFTSAYYRELPTFETLLKAAASLSAR